MSNQSVARRPLATRNTRWAAASARWLLRIGLTPNQVSLASIFFALAAGACMILAAELGGTWRLVLFPLAAVLILVRSLCNLWDGMMAIEGGMQSASGAIYNDLPDRLADSFMLIGAGYSIHAIEQGPMLGWLAALLAMLTAYVRVLGGSAGLAQDFRGVMAKPYRMVVIEAACLVAAIEPRWGWDGQTMTLALSIVIIGCIITIMQRTARIIRALDSRP